ncbi:MAG: cysteine peptidase family C39 domain-containing protein [bacterium]
MRYFLQKDNRSCHIVAVKTILSYYDEYPTTKEIKQLLTKHSFGNLITELAIYLEKKNMRTVLYSNGVKISEKNKVLLDSINEYSTYGKFIGRAPTEKELFHKPVLINVDWYKIRNKEIGQGYHYVVALKEGSDLWLYDGSNYKRRVKTTFDKLYSASLDINRGHDNGMWLIIE